jgi:hypothetical protein
MTANTSIRRRTKSLSFAILALAAAILLLAVDSGEAKKKKKAPFKNGTYTGTTTQGEPIQLDIKKKEATLVFVDVNPPCFRPTPGAGGHSQPSFAGLTGEIKIRKVGKIAFGDGRKKVGSFDIELPGDRGFLFGYVKGKKAEGFASDAYPGCPYEFDWEASRTGPNFFRTR